MFGCGDLTKGQGEACTIEGKEAACKPLCVTGLEGKDYCGCSGSSLERGTDGKRLCAPKNDRVASNIRCCLEKKNNVDLAIVLDSSGSIAPGDFQKALVFISAMVQSLNVSENASRVAIINFSSNYDVVTYLNSIFDKYQLLSKIMTIQQIGSSTATGEALEKCFDIFSVVKGAREPALGVPKVIILLTDGQSNGNVAPVPVAAQLKSTGITVVSLGVGPNLNYAELDGIASPHKVYLLETFQSLIGSFDNIIQEASSSPALIPSQTSRLSVTKNSINYYKAPLTSGGSKTKAAGSNNNKLRVSVNSIAGDVGLFTSFDDENPDGSEVVSDQARRKKRAVIVAKNAIGKVLDIPANITNDSYVYIGIKGNNDMNTFVIRTDLFTGNSSKHIEILVPFF